MSPCDRRARLPARRGERHCGGTLAKLRCSSLPNACSAAFLASLALSLVFPGGPSDFVISDQDPLRELPGSIGIVWMYTADGGGFLPQVLHFRQTEQEGLTISFRWCRGCPYTPTLNASSIADKNLSVDPAALPQRLNYLTVDHIARPYRFGRIGDVVDGVVVVGHAPVSLETLRRDARADRRRQTAYA